MRNNGSISVAGVTAVRADGHDEAARRGHRSEREPPVLVLERHLAALYDNVFDNHLLFSFAGVSFMAFQTFRVLFWSHRAWRARAVPAAPCAAAIRRGYRASPARSS